MAQTLATPEEVERLFVLTEVFEVKRAAGAKAHGRFLAVRAAAEEGLPGRCHYAVGEGYWLSRPLQDCGQLQQERWERTRQRLLPLVPEPVAGGGWEVMPRELERRQAERQVPVTSGPKRQLHGLHIHLQIQYNLRERNQSRN
jgi:hypothetical protein